MENAVLHQWFKESLEHLGMVAADSTKEIKACKEDALAA